uniref:Pqn-59 n=1 Tax=Pristionchus pacificus TaxID=54126 RepID=A0A2A6BI89_PRIPA|eukprot:PDM65612.1 pqn-59 [Pristionchus pacificus]
MGEKQKGRGTIAVPSTDQLRMAKLSIDSSDDASLQKLIKKTTRCSSSQAEVALLDNENDVQRAILYILDRNGEVDCWTEQKSRKAKKEEAEKEAEVTRRSTQETSISRRGGRGVSAPRPSRGTSISRGGSMINRGGGAFARGGGRGGRSTLPTVENSAPSVSQAENSSATAYEEIDWKKGPLVYESSSTTSAPQPTSINLPTAAGPISFAAMAKKATAPAPPPPPAIPAYVPPPPPSDPEPVHEIEPADALEEEEVVVDDILEAVVPEPTPEEPTPEPTVDEVEEASDVAQSWTAELKSNLGIGLEEEKRSLSQRVEFLDTASAAPLNEYQFGFCAPEPQPTTCPNMNAAPSVQEPSFPRSASTQQPQPPAHIQEEVAKASPPSFSRGLSYETTSCVAYPPSENRSMMPPRTMPQPVAQQTGHSSMFPPQMAPYASYAPYMNMYSPVGGGMRAEDPYAAMMQQYPFPGLGQIDLSTILPQGALSSHNTAPPRTEHSDMSKYGGTGGRSESVAPPPGFASNGAPFMAQPSLSSLLVQPPQYPNHPFASFMMPSVSNR